MLPVSERILMKLNEINIEPFEDNQYRTKRHTCLLYQTSLSSLVYPRGIEIGLEQAHLTLDTQLAKKLLIMGPNNTKKSSKSVIFLNLTMNNIVIILPLF